MPLRLVSNATNVRNVLQWAARVGVISTLVFGCRPCAAALCVDYADYRHQVGGVDTPQYAQSIALRGQLAYVADSNALLVIDVASPSSPQILGRVATPRAARTVDIGADDYAYVAHSEDNYGLYVIDVSNPEIPAIVGTVDTPSFVEGAARQGDYLYVAAGSAGLQVVDVSNPLAPAIVGGVSQVGHTFDVAVSGPYAYVAHSDWLLVVDISQPNSPQIVGGVNFGAVSHSVTVSGGYAYVSLRLTNRTEILVIDVSNPVTPQVATTIHGMGGRVTVDDGRAYVGDGLYVHVFDISDPTAPHSVGRLGVGAEFEDSAVGGGHALLAAGWTGLIALDISTPEPSPVVHATPGDFGDQLVRAGDYLYAADGYDGLKITDISNPASPTHVGSLDASWVKGIAHAGSYVYLADQTGVLVVDVADPADPQLIHSVNVTAPPRDVAIFGNFAVVAATTAGIQVIDISNPASASVVGSLATAGAAWGVAIEGNYAYVSSTSSFHVVDLSNPTSPMLLGSTNAPGTNVGVSGGYACTTNESGLHVIDVSDPLFPQVLGTFATQAENRPFVLDGQVAYVGDGQYGLKVVDIVEPGGPRLLGAEYSASYGHSILVDRSLFVSGGTAAGAALFVLPLQCGSTTSLPDGNGDDPEASTRSSQLRMPYPNPARGSVTIPLTLQPGNPVRLSVYDIAGRVVATLVDGSYSGNGRLVWSCENRRGQRLAAGVYWVRLETRDGVEARRLVLQR